MSAKHTPGPWKWDGPMLYPINGSANVITIIDDSGCLVPRNCDADAMMQEIEANKALIAAAPDLLAALNRAARCIDGLEPDTPAETLRDVLAECMAAIAKAEGRA